MAAIEGDHLGPVLTHNPPGPQRVMDVGRWGGVRRLGGGLGGSGRPPASPPLLPPTLVADYSVCQSPQRP